MKLYKSKKQVRAFKLASILKDGAVLGFPGQTVLRDQLLDANRGHIVVVDADWLDKNKGVQLGDYVVTYKGGYVSHNVAAVFEKEHTLIEDKSQCLQAALAGDLYQSNKIVCAGEIEFWGEAEIDTRFVPIIRAHGGIVKELAPVEADRIFPVLKEIHPKATTWFIIYSNGYISVSPGIEFEEGYELLTV